MIIVHYVNPITAFRHMYKLIKFCCRVSNSKKHLYAVTTCSPQPNRACHHILRPKTSSSSSDLSSATNDEHGNTSDFSEDDVTLNELLGKFDESYVYEKETDILSDSEPTDCEDQVEEGKKCMFGLLVSTIQFSMLL